MSEHKVICPCGKKMKVGKAVVFHRWDVKKEKKQDGRSERSYKKNADKAMFRAQYQCACGWSAPLGYGKTEAEAIAEAYRLATLRNEEEQLK